MTAGNRSARGLKRVASWLMLAVIIGFLVFAFAWRVEGGSWERVETPSMGTVAPVGTLLWIKPVAFDSLRVGDFITFHPPGRPGVTYSHRVYKINADHTITTKGVLPAPDPWRLTASNVVGEVQMRWWQMGRVVQAAPVLLAGALVIGAVLSALRRFGRGRWRLPAGVLLTSIVVCIAIICYRPFTGAMQLSSVKAAGGSVAASYVATGVLPVRLTLDGSHVVIRSGEVGTVHVPHTAQGTSVVSLSPDFPWWLWVVLVAACFAPAAVSTAAGKLRAAG